jgi:molybdopterin/thiamine biosynthesis adenylyltransferase
LQRQIAHQLSRVGQPKAESARLSIQAINPDVEVVARVERADAALLHQLVAEADVVLDCSDNFGTRQAVNAACVAHRRPLVSGAAIGFDAQISVYDTRRDHAPCYACVFPAEATVQETACATMGVFAPLVGIIGSMQAAEALKLLTGIGTPLAGRLLLLDARSMEWTQIGVQRAPGCLVCAHSRGV